MALPTDPIMLLSVVNLKLRDYFKNLDALCEDLDADKADLCAKLRAVGYEYDAQRKAARCGLRLRPAAQPVYLIIASKSGTGAQRLCPGR